MDKHMRTPGRHLLAAAVAALCITLSVLLVACSGSGPVRGAAPFVDVTGWHLDGTALSLSLRLRNVNDEDLALARLQLSATLDGALLTDHTESADIVIAANGSEAVDLMVDASAEGIASLAALRDAGRDSLPYAIEGHVQTTNDRRLFFSRQGHLYNVPGRPGHFR